MSQLASSGATELRVRSLDAISQLLTLQVCAGVSWSTANMVKTQHSGKQFDCVTFCFSQSSRRKTS